MLTIYVEMGHEPLMVVSPEGKILVQNIHAKGALEQLPAAKVASAGSAPHYDLDYVADVEDEPAVDEGSDDDQDQQHGHHDDSNDDDSEVESDHIILDHNEPPELYEDVKKADDEDILKRSCEKESQPHEAESVEEEQTENQ